MSQDNAERMGYRRWFVFGEYPDGNVDISDGEGDVFTGVPKPTAHFLIKAREKLCDLMELIDPKDQYVAGGKK